MIYKVKLYFCFLLCVYGQTLNLTEGSKCSNEGVNGTCVSIYRCLTAKYDIKFVKHPLVCEYCDKEPIICCTDCELVNDTRQVYVSDTSGQWYFRNGQKARDKCLDYMQYLNPCNDIYVGNIFKRYDEEKKCYIPYATAIGAYNGKEPKRAKYPHLALLGYGDDVDTAQWLCGGSVISDRYILTAPHCTATFTKDPVRYIALGILKPSDPVELWQIYNVEEIVKHPDYKPPQKYHDIALLKTHKIIEFNENIRPACLHFEQVARDNEATVISWGALGEKKPLADTFQAVKLEEFTEKECSDHFPPQPHLKEGFDPKKQMCYGVRNATKDTCSGDSGGPLQNREHITHCQFFVIGVTASGRECGVSGRTGIYTRVYNYIDWIESVVWP